MASRGLTVAPVPVSSGGLLWGRGAVSRPRGRRVQSLPAWPVPNTPTPGPAQLRTEGAGLTGGVIRSHPHPPPGPTWETPGLLRLQRPHEPWPLRSRGCVGSAEESLFFPGGLCIPLPRRGLWGWCLQGSEASTFSGPAFFPHVPPCLGSLDCPGSVSSSPHPCVSSPPTPLPSFPGSRFLFVVSLSPCLSHVLCVCAFLFLSAGVTSPQFWDSDVAQTSCARDKGGAGVAGPTTARSQAGWSGPLRR